MCANLENCAYFESTFNTSHERKVPKRVWGKSVPLKMYFFILFYVYTLFTESIIAVVMRGKVT